jgi:hypothetical protein
MDLNYPTRSEKRTTNLNVTYILGESVNFRLGILLSLLLLSETFLILRTERDIIMYVGLRIK